MGTVRTGIIHSPDLQSFFVYSPGRTEIIEDQMTEILFGEFLVEQAAITRFQLFRALQLQDCHPGVRIGECAAALGYVPIADVERMYSEWYRAMKQELSSMPVG